MNETPCGTRLKRESTYFHSSGHIYAFRYSLEKLGTKSMGLSLVDYSEISHRGFDLPRGTYIKAVDDGSPAAQAGLKFGDRIIKVNIQTSKSLHANIKKGFYLQILFKKIFSC